MALENNGEYIKNFSLPECIIAVTGSSDRAATAGAMRLMLERSRLPAALIEIESAPAENLISGLIGMCDFEGVIKERVLILSVDIQNSGALFTKLSPSYMLVTNLQSASPSRITNPGYARNYLRSVRPEGTLLILNADDPACVSLAEGDGFCTWFGIGKTALSVYEHNTSYHDSILCPSCGSTLVYKYAHYSNLGDYMCPACEFSRPEPQYMVTEFDGESRTMEINGQYRCPLSGVNTLQGLYSAIAAIAGAVTAGAIFDDAVNQTSALKDHIYDGTVISMLGKRVLYIEVESRSPGSYNRAFDIAAREVKPQTVILYAGTADGHALCDMAFLWQVNFDLLSVPVVARFIGCGKYVNDIANRVSFSNIAVEVQSYAQDPAALKKVIMESGENAPVVICTAADMKKLTEIVPPVDPEEVKRRKRDEKRASSDIESEKSKAKKAPQKAEKKTAKAAPKKAEKGKPKNNDKKANVKKNAEKNDKKKSAPKNKPKKK